MIHGRIMIEWIISLRGYIRCGLRKLEHFCSFLRQSSTVYLKWRNQVWIVHILMKKFSGRSWKYIKNWRSYRSFHQTLFFRRVWRWTWYDANNSAATKEATNLLFYIIAPCVWTKVFGKHHFFCNGNQHAMK